MAKKSRKKSRSRSAASSAQRRISPPSRKLLAGLAEAEALTQRRRWSDAMAHLEQLDRKYPNRPEVLTELVNVAYDLKNLTAYQQYCEQLAQLVPDDPDVRQGLAGAYLSNGYLWLALAEFRRLLRKFPDRPRADDMKQTVTLLETGLEDARREADLADEIALEVLCLDDRVRCELQTGNLSAARKAAQELLAIKPGFVPALNNLSQVESGLGAADRAIELAQSVLALEPDNFQALANLAHFQFSTGNPDQANQTVERFMRLQSENMDIWLKKAEALSFLGRDEDVLMVVAEAEEAGFFAQPRVNPILHHYQAAAAARTGDERLARRAWKAALALDPNFELAKRNLADLKQRPGEREGAWALPLNAWISQQAMQEFQQLPAIAESGKSKTLDRAIRRFARRHEEVLQLVPVFLERGAPAARRLAITLALYGGVPDLYPALQEYLTGHAGPDTLRLETAQTARQQGIIHSGPTPMWVSGEQQEVLQFGFEIHEEPLDILPTAVDELYHDGYEALVTGDLSRAEQLFLQAADIAPDMPQILNNLALVYERQNRRTDTDVLLAKISAEFPDYFFGVIGRANVATQQEDFEHANALLTELAARPKLHISEFRALCTTFAQLLLAQDEVDGANAWLDMWEQIEPDHPDLLRWRLRVRVAKGPAFLQGVVDRLRKR